MPDSLTPSGATKLTDVQIKHMVDRFLAWRLPENFNPDGGISFERVGNKGTKYEYERRKRTPHSR